MYCCMLNVPSHTSVCQSTWYTLAANKQKATCQSKNKIYGGKIIPVIALWCLIMADFLMTYYYFDYLLLKFLLEL